ncbi:hypothetical protein LB565_10485 [Mesorhizobium sp. CA14]|uniref:hypothetical protein n=1 Tax=Mesorhizobium sp. CA14 TaxID=2876642 RepID=UPI001CCEED30|nr:hypothetical protein [Mesorhizobium sp. CA14]MBZ9848408.1 hypothetical protein [Mesorhizobium sp. CA14]
MALTMVAVLLSPTADDPGASGNAATRSNRGNRAFHGNGETLYLFVFTQFRNGKPLTPFLELL